MNTNLYDMITKRRSFHTFKPVGKLTAEDLQAVDAAIGSVKPLFPDIRTKIVLVPSAETSGARGGEYCLLFYSERKSGHMQNIGYIGEQIDLMLTDANIGTLWLGFGRTKAKVNDGLEFVIMMAIAKAAPEDFREPGAAMTRKELHEIWNGDVPAWAEAVRLAPSACNSQPWLVDHMDGKLTVSRHTRRAGIIPAVRLVGMNRIDIGIFLYILQLCMERHGVSYERRLITEPDDQRLEAITAEYFLL